MIGRNLKSLCEKRHHAVLKSYLNANNLNGSDPSNKRLFSLYASDWPLPAIHNSERFGKTTCATRYFRKYPILGDKTGQNAADGHCGIITVPTDLHFIMCLTEFKTSETGGQTQLFSKCQSCVKQSAASQPGFQNLELNRGNCEL